MNSVQVIKRDGIEYYCSFSKLKNQKVNDIKLSIIIPAYNEEKRLGKTLMETINFFKNIKYEIIVINDASKDKTLEVAKQYFELNGTQVNLKIIHYTTNRGKGGAVRLGMLIA